MMKALNDLCDEASTLETSYILLHNEILIQRSFSAFIMPNHLLCKFPYFFLIFHFGSIVTKFLICSTYMMIK